MQAPELETDFDPTPSASRPSRALALISLSVLAIVVTGLAYVQPTINLFPPHRLGAALATHSNYRVAAIDFVSPMTGWLVVDFASGDYAVIHTVDGGDTWTPQLTARSTAQAKFVKFFDEDVGVIALVGTQPVVRRTSDGGRSWLSRPVLTTAAAALSWSFVDSDNGWLLATPVDASGTAPARLYRTDNGGISWVDLGVPIPGPDRAFQVHFSYLTTGWLTTASSGAYAYHSIDFGATWSRVHLPAPGAAGFGAGQFFVAVRPTIGLGAVASVVYFPPILGRTGVGGTIRAYPPLTVRAFDGGRPHTYVYTTILDQLTTGPFAVEPPPNQAQLATTDGGRSWSTLALPESAGAVGYFDASHWWWIGDGMFASSADGGASWTEPRDIGVVDPLSGSLDMLDRSHAWFAGQSGSTPILESTDDAGVHWTLTTLPLLEDRPAAP